MILSGYSHSLERYLRYLSEWGPLSKYDFLYFVFYEIPFPSVIFTHIYILWVVSGIRFHHQCDRDVLAVIRGYSRSPDKRFAPNNRVVKHWSVSPYSRRPKNRG